MDNVARLVAVLRRLVDTDRSVVMDEHHVHLLAACERLVALWPVGDPDAGRTMAAGPLVALAVGVTSAAAPRRHVSEISVSLGTAPTGPPLALPG